MESAVLCLSSSSVMLPSFPRQVYQVLPLPTKQPASSSLHEGLKAFARKKWVGMGKRGACEDVLVLERVGSVVCHPEIRACCGWVRQGVVPGWAWERFSYWTFVPSIRRVLLLLPPAPPFSWWRSYKAKWWTKKQKMEIGFEGIY